MKRILVPAALVGLAIYVLAGCAGRKTEPERSSGSSGIASAHGSMGAGLDTSGSPRAGTPASPSIQAQTGGSPTAAAGLRWRLPARWIVQPDRPMRVATYAIAPVRGDSGGAECAVYYFGPHQGGDVDANFQRWTQQFQPATASRRSSRRVSGLEVSLLQVSGTYTAPGGPMMQSQGSKTGWRLLGAIVGGPQGSVFFKLTGPEKTVAMAASSFDELIGSLRRE